MPPCKHYEICDRDALEGEDRCILHSEDPGKDKEAFKQAFDEHRNKKGGQFAHFVFPIDANFYGTSFSEVADFSDARFEKAAYFRGVTFAKGVWFSAATFNQESDFQESTFVEVAEFSGAIFVQTADLSRAKFTAAAMFNNAIFKETAYFRGCEFTLGAMFGGTTFAKKADFGYADFSCPASFIGSTFGEADFIGTRFAAMVGFRLSRFSGRTAFSPGIQEDEPGERIFSEAEVDFREVAIDSLDALSFRDADLRKCRFIGTDLRKSEFTGVEWPKIEDDLIGGVRTRLEKLYQRLKQNETLRWSAISKHIPSRAGTNLEQAYGRLRQKYNLNWQEAGNRFGVYDEIEAVRKGENDKYPHIERLCRELKQNYEDRRDYERASDFHYGEKEMRRKNREGTNRGLRFLLTLYWLVSGYGERWIRPLIWAAGLLVVCTVLYLFLGLHPKNGGTALTWMSGWDWLESILYSIRVMTLLKPDDLAPDGLAAKFLNTIQSIVGPIILGLFGLAVRQRLKR